MGVLFPNRTIQPLKGYHSVDIQSGTNAVTLGFREFPSAPKDTSPAALHLGPRPAASVPIERESIRRPRGCPRPRHRVRVPRTASPSHAPRPRPGHRVRIPGTASASRTPRPNRVMRRAVPLPAPHPGEQTGPRRGELRREERGLILSHPTKLYLSIKTGALQECDARLPRGQGPRLCQIRAGSRLALGPPAPAAFRVLMAFLLCPPRPHFISLFNAF